MESQILYESLTKPKGALDNNMNNTVGSDNTAKTTTGKFESLETLGNVGTKQDIAQTFAETKSKLKEQLEAPLGHPTLEKNASRFGSCETEIKPPKLNDSMDVDNTQNVSSSLVVSTSEVKSENSDLVSPGMSSNRSSTTSPLPSPGSSVTSTPEVTSSKSLSSRLLKREKRRRRGSAWTDDETEYLMEVWAKQTEIIQQKGGDESVTCAPVYRLISRSMEEQGWEKTWEQCKTRIHTLKRAYKITKDEIAEGSQTITYCRHFDTLEIISGDNPQVTPGMLAANLEQKRKQRGTQLRGKKIPVRRKLTVGENPKLAKKANIVNNVGFPQFQGQNTSLSTDVVGSAHNTPSPNPVWYPPLPTQQQQFQLQQQNSQPPASISNHFAQSTALPVASQYPYHVTPVSGNNGAQPFYNNVAEVNNNEIAVKRENSDFGNTGDNVIKQQDAQWAVPFTQQTIVQSVPASHTTTKSTGSELERMRLDLEMRKLEVERNKIEMEERQRREDRDHQYRMMQLLLFGLGQQNISQLLSGQGPDVTTAHGTDLLRALESGLVPGGSQKVNEKGLSFSEL